MALLNVADVVQSTAALMDDPGQTAYDIDYVLPFLNLRWTNLAVNMSMVGLQYSEEEVIMNVPAGTKDFSNFALAGQPLSSLMTPISLEWKLVGSDDTTYAPADMVRTLDDYPDDSQGIPQFAWKGGTMIVVPSGVDVTARITFDAMAATLVDGMDNAVRGVGDILAYRVAELLYAIGGNMPLQKTMKDFGDEALDDFLALSVMKGQSALTNVPATHRRNGYGRSPFIPN